MKRSSTVTETMLRKAQSIVAEKEKNLASNKEERKIENRKAKDKRVTITVRANKTEIDREKSLINDRQSIGNRRV